MNAFRIQDIKFTGPLALAIVSLPFSVALCNISIGLLGISWIVEWNWREKLRAISTNSSVLIFILFFLLHIIAVAYSTDKQAAGFSVEKKILFIVLPLILVSIKLEKEHLRFLLNLFTISCLTGTLICLGVAYSKTTQGHSSFNFDIYSALAFRSLSPQYDNDLWAGFSYIELASGINIHPSYFSLYLTFCVLILIQLHAESFFYYNKLKQAIILLTLLYLGVFIICLSSRMMTIAFLLVSIYGIIRFLIGVSSFTKWSSAIALCLLFVGVLYLNPVSRFRDYQEVVSTWPFFKTGLQTQSTTIRASLWSLSIKSLPRTNYLIGAGTGDVSALIQKTAEQYGISNILNTSDPHSQYLYSLLGMGIIGLIVLISCFVVPAIIAFRNQNTFYLMFIALFALLCLTESALEVQKGIVFFSLFNSLFLFQRSYVHAYQLKKLKA